MAQKRSVGVPLAALLVFCLGSAAAQTNASSRLAGNWRSTAAVTIPLSKPSSVLPSTDLGAVPANADLNRMLLLLESSPAQQKALTAELANLQNPSSSSYRQWLTPAAFADAYSNSASDISAVVAWLQSDGFTVAPLPAGRGWIEFSGTAEEVEQAFHSQLRLYSTAGGTRAVLTGNISVPAALAPLIDGLVSLDGAVSAPALTTPEPLSVSAAALAAKTSLSGAPALTPQLAAPLLDLDPVHSGGVNGIGETIAIASPSDVNGADVTAFRAAFGLPASPLKIIPDGPDPGLTAGQAEATLAASWAGAAAPGAQIVLVPAATTAATDGVDLSLAAIVDQHLAQVVAIGYSGCEASMSAAHQAFYPAVYRQAAAEGIAIIAASGDSGAAACHAAGSTAPVSTGFAVNALASTPWDTAVGVAGFSAPGASASDSPLAAWSPLSAADPAYAGGGGSSALYPGPSWQPIPSQLARGVGGVGVHNRLMPDLALPTAIDSNSNPGLAFCLSGAATAGSAAVGCSPVRVGGSSAAAALFAGIAALIDQKYGAQGNLSPNLYALSRQSGVFTDVAQGSARLTCVASSPGCASSGQIGFSASSGYDLATGLGVPDAGKLVHSWATPAATGAGADSVTLSVSPIQANSTYNPSTTVTLTANVISLTGGATPTGTVTFYDSTAGRPLSASPSTVDAGGNATLTVEGAFAQGGNEIVAQYSGDSTYAAQTSAPPLNINIQPSTTSLAVVPSNNNPAPGSTITVTVTLTVGSPPAGSVAPTGGVTLDLDGQPALSAPLATASGVTTATFSLTVPSSSTLQTHNLQAVYSGDGNYSGSTSPQISITVNKLAATLTISPSTTTPAAGSSLQVSATVTAPTYGSSQPTGTVSISVDGVAAATGSLTPGSPSTASITIPLISAGTHILQGVYSGDNLYSTSTSSTVSIAAAKSATVTTVTATPATLSAGTPENLTATIAPAAAATGTTYTITGTVTFYDGTTQLGTVVVSSNAAALTGVALANTVSHSITAVYSGDANWLTSSSSALVLLATTKPDAVVLTANYSTTAPGQALVLTATVTPNSTPAVGAEQNPTGLVIFYDGTAVIGSASLAAVASSDSSIATLTSSTLPGGQDTISAVYQGDLYYDEETSNLLSLDVQNFTITPSPSNPPTNLNIVQGSSGSASFIVSGLGGFNNQVQIVCQVPTQADMTCAATPQQVVPTATVTFTVQTFTSGGPEYATASSSKPRPLSPRVAGGMALAFLAFFLVPFGRRVRLLAGRSTRTFLALALLLAGLGGASLGCNSGSGLSPSGTPLGVSTLKIVGSAYVDNTVVSQSVYLTVNVLAKGEPVP